MHFTRESCSRKRCCFAPLLFIRNVLMTRMNWLAQTCNILQVLILATSASPSCSKALHSDILFYRISLISISPEHEMRSSEANLHREDFLTSRGSRRASEATLSLPLAFSSVRLAYRVMSFKHARSFPLLKSNDRKRGRRGETEARARIG